MVSCIDSPRVLHWPGLKEYEADMRRRHRVRYETRTITRREVRAWRPHVRSWQEVACKAGGVAMCRYRCVVEDDFNGEERRPILWYTRGEWDAFLDGVNKGEFDHIVDAPDDYLVPMIDTKEIQQRQPGDFSPLVMAVFRVAGLRAFFAEAKAGTHNFPPDGFSAPDELLVLPFRSYDVEVFGRMATHA